MDGSGWWDLGLDVSGRHSAAVLIDPDLYVRGQWVADFGAAGDHHAVVIERVQAWWSALQEDVEVAMDDEDLIRVVFEDIGDRLISKLATRISGALLAEVNRWMPTGRLPGLVFAPTWQKWIGFVPGPRKRGQGSNHNERRDYYQGWAEVQGFTPEVPDKARPTAKQREDLCAAYCIARYSAGR